MNRFAVVLFFLVVGCHHDHDHGHGHDAGHDHGHSHEEAVNHAHGAVAHEGAGHDHGTDHTKQTEAVAAVAAAPIPFPIGAWTATLQASETALRLTMVDGGGAAVPAEGQARVVLSGTGLDEQRLTLAAVGEAWAGPAKATGAKRYTAVVNVTVGGVTESGKVSWGEWPQKSSGPGTVDHSHVHGSQGHGHGAHEHGDKDHAHKEHGHQ